MRGVDSAVRGMVMFCICGMLVVNMFESFSECGKRVAQCRRPALLGETASSFYIPDSLIYSVYLYYQQ